MQFIVRNRMPSMCVGLGPWSEKTNSTRLWLDANTHTLMIMYEPDESAVWMVDPLVPWLLMMMMGEKMMMTIHKVHRCFWCILSSVSVTEAIKLHFYIFLTEKTRKDTIIASHLTTSWLKKRFVMKSVRNSVYLKGCAWELQ